jgi:glycosyltransferase involved in cell wall biosynthesis
MRICFLADAGSVNTRSWVEGFSKVLGHEVHVVSINRTGEFDPSVMLHHIGTRDGTTDTRGKLGYLRGVRTVRALVRDLKPDLLVGYRVASYGYVGARTGFHPLVVVAQGQYIVSPRYSLPKRVFAATAIREADLIHSWAPHVTERLVELGADPGRILTLHRGIDVNLFRRDPSVAGSPHSVVATRRLSRWYKIDTIVRAVEMAKADVPDLRASIAGDGPAERGLRELADSLGLGNSVSFPGAVPHDELPSLLGASSIYVSAVPSDAVSASLLEAMATGCFPIVRDNAANRHWIENGSNGLLVGSEEPSEYARAIVRACSDDGLRARAAEVNRRTVEERADSRTNLRQIEKEYLALVR